MMIRQPLAWWRRSLPLIFRIFHVLGFCPDAIATATLFILKPSERVPLTCSASSSCSNRRDCPSVVNLVNGGKAAVAALWIILKSAPQFVGSTPIAKYVYARAGAAGSERSAGGAKNHVIVLPDADMKWLRRLSATALLDAPASVVWLFGRRHDR